MTRQDSTLVRTAIRAIGLTFIAATGVLAQGTGTLRGRISDAADRPIADVTVSVSRTTLGGTTSSSGEYVITGVPAGTHNVVVRRLGYARGQRDVDVPAGGEVRADFSLAVAASQLEQVVVTGTAGSVERRQVGNLITTVDVAELTSKASITNVAEALQGKAPGVVFLPGSGAPGTAGEFRIRGMSSISGYKPVVFVDGVRYNIDDLGGFSATGGGTAGLAQSTQVTSALLRLSPNDIESIEIIKGPAAATLYGAEAANGVIQVITKKGSRGAQQTRLGFRTEVGANKWHLIPEDNYTTCDILKDTLTEAVPGSAVLRRPVWTGCGDQTRNEILRDNPLRRVPQALRVGDITRTAYSLSGGGSRYNFYLAGDRDNEQGTFYNSDQYRTSIRSNFGFNPNEKTDISVNLNWVNGAIRLPIQDESVNGLLLSARRGLPGRRSLFTDTTAVGWRTITPAAANLYKNYTNDERVTVAATASYAPVSWFRNRLTAGFDNTNTQAQLLFLPNEISSAQDPDAASGANLRRTPTSRILTLDYSGTVNANPTSDITSSTTFGSQVVADHRETLHATGIGMGAPDVTLVGLLVRTTGNETFSENNSVGYYIQEQVGWRDRLFVTGAVRADDHSSFGTNFDLIVYPKLSVSYILSDEPAASALLASARVSSLQLRGAWGQAGRAPTAYSAPQTYTTDRVTLGTTTGLALRPSSFGNPNLKPERGNEIELGFEAGLLSDRLGLDFTYYNKTTNDMLQAIAVPASTGFLGTYQSNLGDVNNRGIELSVYGTPFQRTNFVWDTRINVGTNRNVLTSFGSDKLLDSPSGQAYGVVQQHRVGYPLGGFWVFDPLRCGVDAPPATPATQPCSAVDTSFSTPILTTAGAAIFPTADSLRKYVGSSSPTRDIGISNTFTIFEHFRFYALFDYKGGFKVFNLQERNRCQAANDNCWRTNDPVARFPGATAQDSVPFKELAVYRHATGISREWIQPGDFWKLREISLTMDAPQRWARRARAHSASLTLSGRNLAVWSDYEGVDPEVNTYGGRNFVRVDAYASPMMRRLSAMINLQY